MDRLLRWIPGRNRRHRDGQKETTVHGAGSALEALRERDSVQAIAARHELHPNQVTTWKRQLLEGLPEVFAGGAGRKAAMGARGEDSGPAREDRADSGGCRSPIPEHADHPGVSE